MRSELTRTLVPCLCAGLAALAGCAGSAGFQQPAPRELPAREPAAVNRPDVARALALRPQLPKPYRLGVYFRDEPDPAAAEWRWEPEDRTKLMEVLSALEKGPEVAAAFQLARATVLDDDLGSIRVAAARHGADAVLVISARDEVERDANAWAASYVALLPILFAPAAEVEVRFLAHAELWDVRNEYLYLAAEAETRAEQTRALPFIDSQEAARAAQTDAVELLGRELARRMARLHGET